MNDNDALERYLGGFRGSSYEEDAMMEYAGRLFVVTPEGVEFSRQGRDKFTPLHNWVTVRVIHAYEDGRIMVEVPGRSWGVYLWPEHILEQ